MEKNKPLTDLSSESKVDQKINDDAVQCNCTEGCTCGNDCQCGDNCQCDDDCICRISGGCGEDRYMY